MYLLLMETIEIELTDRQAERLVQEILRIGFTPISDNLIVNPNSISEDTQKRT
jgi:hypothetical protein